MAEGYTTSTVPAYRSRFGYTGQAWLPSVGLWYYKARMYSPTLGRFMQTDPIGYGDGMNWYNYVRSDPVNLTDPSGLDTDKPIDLCHADPICVIGQQIGGEPGPWLPNTFTANGAFSGTYVSPAAFAAARDHAGVGGLVPERSNDAPQNDQVGAEVIVSGVRCNATCQANLREQERIKWPLLNGQYVLNPYYRDSAPWLTLPNVVAGSVIVAGAAATMPMAVAVEGADAGYAYGAGGRLAQVRFFTNRLIIRLDMATAITPTHINVQGNLFGSRFNFHIPLI